MSSSGEAGDSASAEGGDVMTVNTTIQSYIKQAKRKRATLTQSSSKKVALEVESPSEQIMLPIGRMYHCSKRARGVLIRGIPPTNINFNLSCNYQHMLNRCKNNLCYTEEQKRKSEFYLADTKGVPIWTEDTISIDDASGEKLVPWTLANYISHSNVKYPSKAKFYCVIKGKVRETKMGCNKNKGLSLAENVKEKDPEGEEWTEKEKQGGSPNQDENVKDPEGEEETGKEEQGGSFNQDSTSGIEADSETLRVCQSEPYIPGISSDLKFTPFFVKGVPSKYREQYSWLTTSGEDLSEGKIPTSNPCLEGFTFAGIQEPNSAEMYLIEDLRSDGTVVYKTPLPGSKWGIWSGWEGDYRIAMLAVVVTGGYHSCSTYKWSGEQSNEFVDEIYPLLIVKTRGKYTCTCTISQLETVVVKLVFNVKGGDDDKWVVDAPPQNFSSTPEKCTDRESVFVHRLKHFIEVEPKASSELILKEVLGQGSFGTVHKASWRGSLVAAKVIHMTGRDMKIVEKEVSIMRKLNHPNLSGCLGVEKKPSSFIIISPLVLGSNLQDLIFENPKLLLMGEKCYILIQLCQALVFLHSSTPPFAHLDVKPANVMVDTLTFHATLTDFGLARFMNQTSAVGTKTMLAGSPGYQSPEQLRAESIGPPSDVYGYGAVVYVTISNSRLWPGLSHFQIMAKVVANETPSTENLPSEFKKLCNACFQQESKRPLATDILFELQKIINN